MSIALMTAAFKTDLPSTQKFVFVALCDAANDQGECYPSIRLLAEKCSLGERTVQDAVSALEVAGYVRRDFRIGRSTVYWLFVTPAVAAPRSSRTPQIAHPTPADCAPPPPQQPHPTPAVAAPITVKEPSVEPSKNRKRIPDTVSVLALVEAGFEESDAEDFIAHKARLKAPLTERAWKDHLREAERAGWSPAAAAEKVMAKGWRGFEAKYVEGERQLPRGKTPTFRQLDAAAARAKVAVWTGGLLGGEDAPDDFIDMEKDNATLKIR